MSMSMYARDLLSWLLVSGLLAVGLTACETQGTRIPQAAGAELSSGWSDTDARVTAETMIQEALEGPWLQRFTQFAGRSPVVSVGTVLNRTHAYLNTQTFIKELQRAIASSSKVQFAADAGQRQEVRQERAEQGQNVRPDTVKPAGQELGADFILQGSMQAVVDELGNTTAIYYQVDLELLDIASNVKVWVGQKRIKKLVERSKTTL